MSTLNNMALMFILALLCLPLTDCRSRRGDQDRFASVRSEIIDFMKDENVPSVSVAVAGHGTIVWEESFGWANPEKKIKATPNTMYEIASIAKVYTVTALMVLRERGLLNLDAPVESYLGGIKIKSYGFDASGVTLRRIVQHTSGLPMYWGKPSRTDSSQTYTQKDMFDRYAILAFRPGERELYSNLGIGMLTYVIEKVSGQPYAQFLKQNVFLPLGMHRTAYLSTPATTDDFAQQYDRSGQPWIYDEGFYASAHDLLRFGMFHLKDHLSDQRPVLSDSTIDLMQTAIDPMSDFRLPWWVWDVEGYKALVFTGASGTIIGLLPEADLAIVVLANRLQANTPKIAGRIAEVMLEDVDQSKRVSTPVQTHEKFKPGSLSRESLAGEWKGTIVTPERVFPVELSFGESGSPRMRIGKNGGLWGERMEPMSSLPGDYSGGIFSAYFPIQIPIADTKGHDHWTWIYVALDGDTLRGYAVAHASGGPYFGLPYVIRLER